MNVLELFVVASPAVGILGGIHGAQGRSLGYVVSGAIAGMMIGLSVCSVVVKLTRIIRKATNTTGRNDLTGLQFALLALPLFLMIAAPVVAWVVSATIVRLFM
jgi:hypothetical protein